MTRYPKELLVSVNNTGPLSGFSGLLTCTCIDVLECCENELHHALYFSPQEQCFFGDFDSSQLMCSNHVVLCPL